MDPHWRDCHRKSYVSSFLASLQRHDINILFVQNPQQQASQVCFQIPTFPIICLYSDVFKSIKRGNMSLKIQNPMKSIQFYIFCCYKGEFLLSLTSNIQNLKQIYLPHPINILSFNVESEIYFQLICNNLILIEYWAIYGDCLKVLLTFKRIIAINKLVQ